ncbi:hypothetical protein E4T51_02458 [Aureobasidium sp. EXF-12344]|nr:hypothetical protein E4T51_02458 [Aureobasidium sp. EXF-12344]
MTPERTALSDLGGHKQNRACQACRASKVRCRRLDDGPSCARCSKAGRPCVPSEESSKRQKRLDTRSVENIETRLKALTDILQHRGVDTSATPTNTAERTNELDTLSATALLDAHRPASSFELSAAQVEPSICDIINDETTSMIFDHFRANMLQHFPFVAFSSDVDASEIRETRPILLLAILDAAGDGYFDMEIARRLRKRLTQIYSTYALENSTDGMTMLQALIISVLWNKSLHPPQVGAQLDALQSSYAAANMAKEMGLESRLRSWSWNKSLPIQSDRLRGATSEYQFSTLEVRRIWLACYYISSKYMSCISRDDFTLTWSSASLATQTRSLVSWSRQMDECLEVLSTSPAALASDKMLCAYVRLQHVLEEFEAQLPPGLGPKAVGIAHRAAKRQLAEWATSLHIWNDSLRSSQQFVTLYIHELVMTTDPSADNTPGDGGNAVTISQSELSDCLTSAHNSLDSFLTLDMPLIRTLPTSYFVQVTHTALILVKLHFAAARLSDHADAAQKILVIGADAYLGRLLAKCRGWGTLWPAQKLVETLRRLRELLQRCSDQTLASKLAWLNAWTLERVSDSDVIGQTNRTPIQSGYGGEAAVVSQCPEIVERTTLSTSDEDMLAWCVSSTDQINSMQDVPHPTLPSASLDASQLIDWFGTDLNTSTFDFDGNLQSMIQFG